jgi:transitional endoplasmic reticulum ATPase
MTQNLDPVVAALRASLAADPGNVTVWLHLADLLTESARIAEAIDALRSAASAGAPEPDTSLRLISLLRREGQLSEALIRAEQLAETFDPPELQAELYRIHRARGDDRSAAEVLDGLRRRHSEFDLSELESASGAFVEQGGTGEEPRPAVADDATRIRIGSTGQQELDDWVSQFDYSEFRVSFDDVVGLDDVKRQLRLRIIAPQENREVYRAFHRKAGGGILLYGPPGCGKTFIARATAGECGATFLSVGIHEIVDQYFGQTEKAIHALFEEARRNAPTVLFFDEFDAFGSQRGVSSAQSWKTMVDQLLNEMDGISGDNEDLLVFAATNVPWNVDAAFRRPGRFDRMFFVPPPDDEGRAELFRRHCSRLPGGDALPIARLVKGTKLWTGADIRALAERASEAALEKSLDSGEIHPVTLLDFERELQQMDSSALEWISTARNYARYSNQGGQYDDLRRFLESIKRW